MVCTCEKLKRLFVAYNSGAFDVFVQHVELQKRRLKSCYSIVFLGFGIFFFQHLLIGKSTCMARALCDSGWF